MTIKPSVLIVEDDPLSQDMLARRLSGRGFRAATASTGNEALRCLASEPFDLVLLDLMLPDINGMEVLRQLKTSIDAPPVIVVSAKHDSDDIVAALDGGASDYIGKPINFRVLLARMNVALRLQYQTRLLVEAERQRARMQALGQSAVEIAAPMEKMIGSLEKISKMSTQDQAGLRASVGEAVNWAERVVDMIEELQKVSSLRSEPYTTEIPAVDETRSDK